MEYFARQYGDGKVSLARASREAGVTIWEMMDYVSAKKIPAQYDIEDLKKDLLTLQSRNKTEK